MQDSVEIRTRALNALLKGKEDLAWEIAKDDRELLPHVTKESWLEHGYRSIALGRPDII